MSLARRGDALLAVFPDWETTSLSVSELPLGPELPAVPPIPRIIDKIDAAPPLSPSFGLHVLAARGGVARVLYIDRESGDRLVLKLASRGESEKLWTLDVVEPQGLPVAVVPGAPGRIDLFWARGSLLFTAFPGLSAPATLLSPFLPVGRASLLGDDGEAGFTVYDSASRTLLAFRRDGDGFRRTPIPEGGPVHSAILTPEGLIAVVSWNPEKKRISLLEQEAGGEFRKTTVTLCEGTHSVAILQVTRAGAGAPPSRLYLFDETTRTGAGRASYALCMIEPGNRYRRKVLLASAEPIACFSALAAEGALYVLVLHGKLDLLRLGLQSFR